jgi:cell wall-associated NlpC family hydrolase
MEPWTNDYIGIPYLFGGDDRNGIDCWGLVRLVLSERYDKHLPEYFHDSIDSVPGLIRDFTPKTNVYKVDSPSTGDLVLFLIHGKPMHIGIVVGNPGERNMLHTLIGHDSALDQWDCSRWIKRVEGFYRAA